MDKTIAKKQAFSQLNFHFPRVILEEVFLFTPLGFADSKQSGDPTIEEVASISGLSIAAVIQEIEQLKTYETDSERSWHEWQQQETVSSKVIDVRLEPRDHPFMIKKLNLEALKAGDAFERLQQFDKMLLVCDDGSRSYSATMYLRRHGIHTAYYLKGGLQSLSG